MAVRRWGFTPDVELNRGIPQEDLAAEEQLSADTLTHPFIPQSSGWIMLNSRLMQILVKGSVEQALYTS